MSGTSSPSLDKCLACSDVFNEESSIAWDGTEVLAGDGPLKTSFRTEEVKRGEGEKSGGVAPVGGASGIDIVGVAPPVKEAGVVESTVSCCP